MSECSGGGGGGVFIYHRRESPLILSEMPTTEGMRSERKPRILSIQSHVVSGYVGNKAATFPLQLLGFDVDVINSVHLSNHTGYPSVRGDVMKGEQLCAILEGLQQNSLLNEIGHVLTGYIGSESFLEAVMTVLTALREEDNRVRFVCDPVLGDKGRFYVPVELVEVYKTRVIPIADVLTPNQFEAEQLTGVTVDSMESAQEACKVLHHMGPTLVFITSFVLPDRPDTMAIIASQCVDSDTRVWIVEFPVLPGHFTGTGDLCAALLLAHTILSTSVPDALERVINTMSAVLERTLNAAGESVQSRELKLIQSKAVIEKPPRRFQATQLR